ncbi:condensation domain-containing protein [Nocardioides albertanoniae]|uniref:Condensation domain-containing protein n=1 Tax=Nocardioides albertanoniae TaxID=1175486 RepID=A0A543A6H4_9ACTN|nr:condensation domain-containing protein [Nocardioides albertanoniae]TQL68203.1 condensation domain-containing protein [Nocardioides albertanoniae]
MEYTELSAYDVPSGEVTAWIPTAEPAAWNGDERELSHNHEQHLATAEAGSWIGSIMRLPGRLDTDALSLAMRAWTGRHEALRGGVEETATGWRRRILAPADVSVQATSLGRFDGDGARSSIADLFAERIDPKAWPYVVFATVSEPDTDGFTLAFGADHGVMDAYSQLLWFEEIASLYEAALAGESFESLAAPTTGSHLDHSAQERVVGAEMSLESESVQVWRDWLTSADGTPRFADFPVPGITDVRGSDEGEGASQAEPLPQASMSQWLGDHRQARVLGELCKSAGVSFQAGMMGAMAHVLRAQHGVEQMRFVAPMHTRYTAEHAVAIGWYVGLVPVTIDIAGAATLPEVAGRVQAALEETRSLVRQPFARVADLLDVDDAPHFVVTFVDTRFISGAEHWNAWEGRTLRAPVNADDEVYFWLVRDRDGVNVSTRYPETVAAERVVRDLIGGMSALLAELGGLGTADLEGTA